MTVVTRLSVDDAARHLGLSRPTVKRRLKSGALRGVQEKTPSGFKWFILVDDTARPRESPAGIPRESPREFPNGGSGRDPTRVPG